MLYDEAMMLLVCDGMVDGILLSEKIDHRWLFRWDE
jgi:hypothetical protein